MYCTIEYSYTAMVPKTTIQLLNNSIVVHTTLIVEIIVVIYIV